MNKLLFLLLVSCTINQPKPTIRTWGPTTTTIVLPPNAPPCAKTTLIAAYKVLAQTTPIIKTGIKSTPHTGEILIIWNQPESNLINSVLLGQTRTWVIPNKTTENHQFIMKATIESKYCNVRLLAHELGHALGLKDTIDPGRLMTHFFPTGDWKLTKEERIILDRVKP